MGLPRQVIPGATSFVTRRVSHRTFRLRPDPDTNQIVGYCLAWAASRFGVLFHAIGVMSDHVHLVLTDPRGELPNFLRELHRNIAKALNAAQNCRENLWSTERCSVVLLPTVDDVVAKIAYTAANPVAAGLVETPEEWPGVLQWQPGTTLEIQRPRAYFDPNGCSPKVVKLEIVPVPDSHLEPASCLEKLAHAVRDEVRRAAAKVRARGRRFMGAARVRATGFLERAKSYESLFGINPTLAARDITVRKAYVAASRAFQLAYRLALDGWRAGNRAVAFPFGTWWMRVHHGAAVLLPA